MQVVIPAAGMGNRLGNITRDKTKCMVEINDQTLIERSLDILTQYDISRIVLIVGYHKDKLIEFLGDSYSDVPIVYVSNDIYDRTNNIYSIYLAKDELVKDDTILLESDLIFDETIIKNLLSNQFDNLAVIDKYQAWMDGTVVTINNKFDIVSFIDKENFSYDDVEEYYKTVNIYKFSKQFLEGTYVPFLEAYSKALGNNEYYEQVLKVISLLNTKELKAMVLNGEKWYEIDDVQDLDNAEVIFSKPKEKLAKLTKRYGGYWRYEDIVDFCYLVNPYFPTANLMGEMQNSFETLLGEYPSGADIQSLLAGKLFNCQKDQIVVGNGASELIDQLAKVLDFNIKLGLFTPTFEEYSSRFKNISLETLSADDCFRYDKESVKKLAENNDGVILINPDNPSGNFIDITDIKDLITWFKEENKLFIVDESFVDFSENHREASLLSRDILDLYSGLIVIKSISKSYGVPGSRLGVLATSSTDLISKIKKDIPVWNINSFGEFFLQIIGKYKKDYQKSCDKIVSERNNLIAQINQLSFIKAFPSQANYVLCELLKGEPNDLAVYLLEKHTLLVKDCSEKLGFTGDKCYIRLAVRDSRDNQQLVDGLIAYQEEHYGV